MDNIEPILPDSDEEVVLEKRVFDALYNGEHNLYNSGYYHREHVATIQELWRQFVLREAWYPTNDKPRDWYVGYVDALKHFEGDCPPGGYKGPNAKPVTDYDFGWNAGWKASS
ncbi:hypothetical protein OMEGA_188 [Klebsiella phage vB_KaeM_KaOmega]|nr:hypothetical protein OMEGA_188 [Klebsiella phage vB_KaeM_KaOmega]